MEYRELNETHLKDMATLFVKAFLRYQKVYGRAINYRPFSRYVIPYRFWDMILRYVETRRADVTNRTNTKTARRFRAKALSRRRPPGGGKNQFGLIQRFHRAIRLYSPSPQITAAPIVHGFQNRFDAFAESCQRIFNLWRDNGKNMPFNQPVRFQFPQLLRQHFCRRVRNFPAQGGKTQRSGHQFPQNQRFVFAAD